MFCLTPCFQVSPKPASPTPSIKPKTPQYSTALVPKSCYPHPLWSANGKRKKFGSNFKYETVKFLILLYLANCSQCFSIVGNHIVQTEQRTAGDWIRWKTVFYLAGKDWKHGNMGKTDEGRTYNNLQIECLYDSHTHTQNRTRDQLPSRDKCGNNTKNSSGDSEKRKTACWRTIGGLCNTHKGQNMGPLDPSWRKVMLT